MQANVDGQLTELCDNRLQSRIHDFRYVRRDFVRIRM